MLTFLFLSLSLPLPPVPACDGKGSYESLNGIKATEYLIQAEELCSRVSLFSWVLFRPPWSLEVVSSKMCVFHHMRLFCQKAETEQKVGTIHMSLHCAAGVLPIRLGVQITSYSYVQR